jgi:hypothetical protein
MKAGDRSPAFGYAMPKTFLTPEQYLEIERKAEYKSEFFIIIYLTHG